MDTECPPGLPPPISPFHSCPMDSNSSSPSVQMGPDYPSPFLQMEAVSPYPSVSTEPDSSSPSAQMRPASSVQMEMDCSPFEMIDFGSSNKKTKNGKASLKKRKSKKNTGHWNIKYPVIANDLLFSITKIRVTSRAQLVSKVWKYVRQHGLQDQSDHRMILPDEKMSELSQSTKAFDGIIMIPKCINRNLQK